MSYVQTMAKALRHYGAVNPTAKKPPRIQVRAPRAGHYYRTHARIEAWKKRNEEWKKKQQKNRPVPLGGYGFRKRQLEAWKNSKWGQAKLKHQKELREFQEKYKREKIAKNKAKK